MEELKKRAGFTLIELLAVLAIMGLMMGLAVKAFVGQGSSGMRGSVLQFRAALNNARQFAITRRIETSVVYGNLSGDEQGYYLVTTNVSKPDLGIIGDTNYLFQGIQFTGTETNPVTFRLDGSCRMGSGAIVSTITIGERGKGTNGLITDLNIYPLTGRVKVKRK